MHKAQVSVEFIVLFTIILFAFALLISFFPDWIENAAATRNLPDKTARDIKAVVITASLSESDFASEFRLPERIGSASILVNISQEPDNLLVIRERESNQILAKAFLPRIEEVTGSVDDLTLIIRKTTSDNRLVIERQP